MSVQRRGFLTGLATATILAAKPASAQATPVRIGILTDLSGNYRDTGGLTEIACAKQAVQDFGGSTRGIDVDIIFADHQERADIGLGIARKWLDQDGIDVILGVSNSSIALAVTDLVRQHDKIHLNTGAATTALTGSACNRNTAHYAVDTWCRANSTAGSILRAGGKSWYFITPDYTFGHTLQQEATAVIKAGGGSVTGSVLYPFPGTSDFSAQLLQAGSSNADVIAFASSGDELSSLIKQAREFRVGDGKKLATLAGFVTDIHPIGVTDAQGLELTENFYWDLNDRTRAFTNRGKSKVADNWPNTEHAGAYSAVLHYLKVVAAMGVAQAKQSGSATMDMMKKMPCDDDCFGPGYIRSDGRKIHPAYLFQVKSAAESTGPWDLFKLMSTVPAEQAFRPLAEGGCSLIHS
jgi:branched-chain amino acid transport system substrate-binding protein